MADEAKRRGRKPAGNEPEGDEKSFSITISALAHENLRKASEEYGVGQKYVLTFLLEGGDFSAVKARVDELKRQRERERLQGKFDSNDIVAYLKLLSPEEREQFLAGFKVGG